MSFKGLAPENIRGRRWVNTLVMAKEGSIINPYASSDIIPKGIRAMRASTLPTKLTDEL